MTEYNKLYDADEFEERPNDVRWRPPLKHSVDWIVFVAAAVIIGTAFIFDYRIAFISTLVYWSSWLVRYPVARVNLLPPLYVSSTVESSNVLIFHGRPEVPGVAGWMLHIKLANWTSQYWILPKFLLMLDWSVVRRIKAESLTFGVAIEDACLILSYGAGHYALRLPHRWECVRASWLLEDGCFHSTFNDDDSMPLACNGHHNALYTWRSHFHVEHERTADQHFFVDANIFREVRRYVYTGRQHVVYIVEARCTDLDDSGLKWGSVIWDLRYPLQECLASILCREFFLDRADLEFGKSWQCQDVI